MYLIAQTRVLGGGALLSCCSHHGREYREGNGTSRANHWALSSSGWSLDGATGWCYCRGWGSCCVPLAASLALQAQVLHHREVARGGNGAVHTDSQPGITLRRGAVMISPSRARTLLKRAVAAVNTRRSPSRSRDSEETWCRNFQAPFSYCVCGRSLVGCPSPLSYPTGHQTC